jgi:hypothetical protein
MLDTMTVVDVVRDRVFRVGSRQRHHDDRGGGGLVRLTFSGELWYWRGPAPWYFVTVPEPQCRDLQALAGFVSYGWGMIPVTATIGATTWRTSLFPKNGSYVVPVKAKVRKDENLDEGRATTVHLSVDN